MAHEKRKLAREGIAHREIGRTWIRPSAGWMLVAMFLATIFAVPLTQAVHELREHAGGRRRSAWPGCFDIFAAPPRALEAFHDADGGMLDRLLAANRSLQRDVDEYESTLEDDSLLARHTLPPVQQFMTSRLGLGNEKVYVGRDGWLFYRPGVDYLTGPGFLDPRRLARRAAGGSEWRPAPQPDPRKAILRFKRQLAERGITLIVVPTPGKAQARAEHFSRRFGENTMDGQPHADLLHNASYGRFLRELAAEGVLVLDVADSLTMDKRDSGGRPPRYLAADTHWRPEAMEKSADYLATAIRRNVALPPVRSPGHKRVTASAANLGDIARMLRLPADQELYPRETVEIHPVVTATGELWRPRRDADVLLLGDSFANVYSLDAMGWGAGAGLAEQFSFAMKRPIDVIIRNDAGAHATREILSRQLARGVDRLAGKKLVLWQFAERELAVGDWKLLDMTLGPSRPSRFVALGAGETMTVTAVVVDASGVPRPGSVPYKDHIRSLHLTDLRDGAGRPIAGAQAVVYVRSMRDNVHTSGASLRAGQEVKLRLRPWSDVEGRLGRINRSELDDEDLAFETPCWGEMMK